MEKKTRILVVDDELSYLGTLTNNHAPMFLQ